MSPSQNALRLTVIISFLTAGLATGQTGPELIVDGGQQATSGVPIFVPMIFISHGHEITAIAFSLDLDLESLDFDPADDDGDGIPDVVTFPFGAAGLTVVNFDAGDEDGELDVLLAELSGLPFSDGLLMELELFPATAGQVSRWIRFSQDPAPSFGNAQGEDVPGTVRVIGDEIFADNFESGDLSGWSSAVL